MCMCVCVSVIPNDSTASRVLTEIPRECRCHNRTLIHTRRLYTQQTNNTHTRKDTRKNTRACTHGTNNGAPFGLLAAHDLLAIAERKNACAQRPTTTTTTTAGELQRSKDLFVTTTKRQLNTSLFSIELRTSFHTRRSRRRQRVSVCVCVYINTFPCVRVCVCVRVASVRSCWLRKSMHTHTRTYGGVEQYGERLLRIARVQFVVGVCMYARNRFWRWLRLRRGEMGSASVWRRSCRRVIRWGLARCCC